MRRTVTVIMLSVVLFEAGGMVFGVQLRQWIHKVSVAVIMDIGARPDEIVRMQMSVKEFDRIKVHEREFRLNNEMYDVVWRETSGTDYIIYCFRDAEEEKMVAKFLRFLSNSTAEEKGTAHRQSAPVIPGFVLAVPVAFAMIPPCEVRSIISLPPPPAGIEGESTIDTPPPRTAAV